MFFFKAINEQVKIIRLLTFTIISYHFFIWIALKTFGNTFWARGDSIVKISELVKPVIDGGYIQHLENIMLFACCFLSGYLSKTRFRKTYIFAVIYFLLFLDNSLSFHESFFFNVNENLEIIVWFLPIISLIIWFAKSKKRKISHKSMRFAKYNIALFILLGIFGIFLDQFVGILIWLSDFKKSFIILNFPIKILMLFEEIGEIFTIGIIFTWLINLTGTSSKN